MPEIVSCPKCQRKSRVPDALVGKKVKCPSCGETFTADLAPPPPPPEEKREEDEGETYGLARGKKRHRSDDSDEDYEVVNEKKRRRSDDEAVADRPRRS